MISEGVRAISPVYLLTLAATRSEPDCEANEVTARQLVQRFGLKRLGDLSGADLFDAFGLEPYEAARVLAAIELGQKVGKAGMGQRDEVSTPEDAYEVFKHLADEPQEKFCVAFMTAKNTLIGFRTVHVGTLTSSIVGTREVYREAIRENAASIVFAHNHPSGDPSPSPEDIQVTHRLIEAGKLLGIDVLDHIVVGHHGFVSLRRRGLM